MKKDINSTSWTQARHQ